jgi:four helix bundle protein
LREKKEYILSKQTLRSGTSIGANVNEAVSGESRSDFVHKLSIATKECRETIYWLNLMKDSHFISNQYYAESIESCQELLRILNSMILTLKRRTSFNS